MDLKAFRIIDNPVKLTPKLYFQQKIGIHLDKQKNKKIPKDN